MKAMKPEAISEIPGNIEVDLFGAASLDSPAAGPELEKARQLLPGARSVIVMAMEIPEEVFRHLSFRQEVGNQSLRDLYHQTEQLIAGRLDWEAYKLVKRLHAGGFKALALPAGGPYDPRFLSGPFSYKHAARAAGLGHIGRNSLLITPQYGPRIKLAAVLTNASLKATTKDVVSDCAKCAACVRACPAKAIIQPESGEDYHIDTHACNSFLAAVGLCAECMKVCPKGRGKGAKNEPYSGN